MYQSADYFKQLNGFCRVYYKTQTGKQNERRKFRFGRYGLCGARDFR